MEVMTCLKSVLHALNQYKHNATEVNLIYLQRQMEVLISITSTQAAAETLDAKDLLVTDCITAIIAVLSDAQHSSFLAHKIFILLHNLCASESIRQSFHEVYHLIPTLSSLLISQPLSPSDVTVFMALKLLQRVTYNCKLSYEDGCIDDLLIVLVRYVLDRETDLTVWCLIILSNLCRSNPSVQRTIKRMDQMKALYKKLMEYLGNKNQNIIISALSLLVSFCLHDPFGEKVFSPQSINQTFQVAFNVLITVDSGTLRRYSADLFIDMVKHKRIQEALSSYEQLPLYLKELLSVLISKEKDAEQCGKLFELLQVFSSISGVSTMLCKLLTDTMTNSSSPFKVILEWSCAQPSPSESFNSTIIKAMELMKNIYEELIDMDVKLTEAPHTTVILPMLRNVLFLPLHGLRTNSLATHLARCSLIVQIWNGMCVDEDLREVMCGLVGCEQMSSLIDFQYKNNPIALHGKTSSKDPDDWGILGSDLIIRLLDLAYSLRHSSEDMRSLLCSELQNSKLMPFLSYSITADSRDRVQSGLRLIQFAATFEDFPLVVLGDAIMLCNCERNTSSNAAPQGGDRFPDNESSNVNMSASMSRLSHSSETRVDNHIVENLIERFQHGMELKDVRSSEIIALYEHQLQSLQTKEEHLQDLLDAKAMALSHADKLIAQYRARKAQTDAEMNKLRLLLTESERSRDDYHEKLEDVTHDRDKLQAEAEQLSQENARLEIIAEEHKELQHAHSELQDRAENLEGTIQTLQQERDTLTQMYEALQRHNEALKQQHDVACQQLAKLDEERKSMSRVIKEKENRLQEIDRTSKKSEEMLRRTQADKEELEVALDKLRLDLTRAEQHKKELQHQVSTLELLCQKHEREIREKDAVITEQKVTIDQHAEIVNLIHNISSGRGAAGQRTVADK